MLTMSNNKPRINKRGSKASEREKLAKENMKLEEQLAQLRGMMQVEKTRRERNKPAPGGTFWRGASARRGGKGKGKSRGSGAGSASRNTTPRWSAAEIINAAPASTGSTTKVTSSSTTTTATTTTAAATTGMQAEAEEHGHIGSIPLTITSGDSVAQAGKTGAGTTPVPKPPAGQARGARQTRPKPRQDYEFWQPATDPANDLAVLYGDGDAAPQVGQRAGVVADGIGTDTGEDGPGSSSLLDGEYNPQQSALEFQQALAAWRGTAAPAATGNSVSSGGSGGHAVATSPMGAASGGAQTEVRRPASRTSNLSYLQRIAMQQETERQSQQYAVRRATEERIQRDDVLRKQVDELRAQTDAKIAELEAKGDDDIHVELSDMESEYDYETEEEEEDENADDADADPLSMTQDSLDGGQ